MNIKDKIAIVTGASSGIGEATATLLSQKGAKVVLAARSKDKLMKLSKKLDRSLVVPTDMTKERDTENLVSTAVKQFGRIDILVNNAGRGYDAAIEHIDMKTFHEIFELDLVGPLRAMQLVIPIMRKKGGGAIVNISSGTALMHYPNMGGYSSLKRALVGISLTAADELKKDHITVSVVYPIMTNTNFEKNTVKGKEIPFDWSTLGGGMPQVDPPELIAERIVEAVETGKQVVYAHDWMGKPR